MILNYKILTSELLDLQTVQLVYSKDRYHYLARDLGAQNSASFLLTASVGAVEGGLQLVNGSCSSESRTECIELNAV